MLLQDMDNVSCKPCLSYFMLSQLSNKCPYMQFSKVNAMLDPQHAKMNTKHFVLKNYDTKGITIKPITEGGAGSLANTSQF